MILANIFGLANPWDIGIIAVVALVLFGGTRIAGFGKSLGEGLKEFKKATHEDNDVKEAPVAKVVASDQPISTESTKKVD
jgi:sec-independent protein translocase protein TatA